jgi:serine/threonine-protein kinase HipA
MLVVERFDRAWAKDGRLIRVPQEDFCQALSYPPSRKYQDQGGPGIGQILDLLKGGDTPAADQKSFLKAQILFWLIGATDGLAKNFSVFLGPGGSFRLTPIYDVLTAQPSLDTRQIERKQMKLAMIVGDSRHYKIDEIKGRHFIQTAERAGLPKSIATDPLEEVAEAADTAMKTIEKQISSGFPEQIYLSVSSALASGLNNI